MQNFSDGELVDGFSLSMGRTYVFQAVTATPAESRAIGKSVRAWARAVRFSESPAKKDAAELAKLAHSKWEHYRKGLETAARLTDLREKVRDNEKAEVAILLVARAPWLPRQQRLAGICLIRRTWCNNIYIDFLAKHPRVEKAATGTALLWYVCGIAEAIRARVIWGETTRNSGGYHAQVLGKPRMTDRLVITSAQYRDFRARTTAKYLAASKESV